jgi:glycosyltransferase involved in cell wall biosynthesis
VSATSPTAQDATAPSRLRPRLVVLATTLPVAEGDATPAFVLSLAQALTPANEITILAPRVPGAPAYARIGDVVVRRFPYFPSKLEGLADGAIIPNLRRSLWRVVEVPFLLLAFLGAGAREVRRSRPDLIHAHWILPAGLVAGMLRTMFGVPYIVTGHGADVFALQAAPFRALKRWVMKKAAVVSATSSEGAAALELAEEERARLVVPMGVDVAGIELAVGERNPEPGRFLFVGRLVEKKGLDVLLTALKYVPSGHVVVIGDGPERARLETLALELGIAARVTFLGHQGQARVVQELRRAYAVVVPSRVARDGDRDTTPLVMSEGMAAGVPVIASRVGGLPERIVSGQNGLLVEPDDVHALAEGLAQVLADPDEAARWADAARRMIRKQLDIRVTARRYQEFIDATLNRTARGAQPPRSARAGKLSRGG